MSAAPTLGVALLFLLGATAALAAPTLEARVLTRGHAAPGSEIAVQIEVQWDGRPEAVAPGVPSLAVPAQAGLVLGRTGSSFDGDRSRWWTNATVTLPDTTQGPWSIGPAAIPVVLAGGEARELTAEAKVLGQRARRGLLGQGLASGVVVALMLGAFAALWRRTAAAPSVLGPLADAVRAALDSGSLEAALERGLELHAALAEDDVAVDYLPPAQCLIDRREAIRFAGAAPDPDGVRAALRPLLTIAGALDPEPRR